jgi:hypothetical protein
MPSSTQTEIPSVDKTSCSVHSDVFFRISIGVLVPRLGLVKTTVSDVGSMPVNEERGIMYMKGIRMCKAIRSMTSKVYRYRMEVLVQWISSRRVWNDTIGIIYEFCMENTRMKKVQKCCDQTRQIRIELQI